jgi:ferredoxin
VFVQLEDGIAYVAERGEVLNDPGGSGSLAAVSPRNVVSVLEAAEVCPGECIFIDIDDMDDDLLPAAGIAASAGGSF